jgi:hypothetical protein
MALIKWSLQPLNIVVMRADSNKTPNILCQLFKPEINERNFFSYPRGVYFRC